MATKAMRDLVPVSGREDFPGHHSETWRRSLVLLGRAFGSDLIRQGMAFLRRSRAAKAPARQEFDEHSVTGAWRALALTTRRPKAGESMAAQGTAVVPLSHRGANRRGSQVGRTTAFVHDLNNLLSIVQVNLQLLDSEISDRGHRALIKDARDATELCDELIQGLYAERKGQPSRPQPIDLNEELVRVGNLIQKRLGSEIEVVCDLAEDLGSVCVDPALLRNAVLNLVANARDAMPSGGRVFIATSNVEIDVSAAASHIDARPGAYVVISLRDSGPGIPAETLRRVFDPYFSTKTPDRSLGVGLTLVREFCQEFEGFVRVESELGEGTRVSIFLPRRYECQAGF